MKQLKQRQAKDVDYFGIERRERPTGVGRDEDVEGALPAQRSRGDLAGKCAIAFVLNTIVLLKL